MAAVLGPAGDPSPPRLKTRRAALPTAATRTMARATNASRTGERRRPRPCWVADPALAAADRFRLPIRMPSPPRVAHRPYRRYRLLAYHPPVAAAMRAPAASSLAASVP